MPTRQAESIHEAEQNHPKGAPVESPSADAMKGATSLPQEGNADDAASGDQDIDTAGTAHDDESPTKSM